VLLQDDGLAQLPAALRAQMHGDLPVGAARSRPPRRRRHHDI
jgi:hypothetical protein